MTSYRVLDLAGESGAYCSRLLAGLGMDVLKIEPPGGDPCRLKGPFAGGKAGPEKSLPFWYLNAGKRGLTLDLAESNSKDAFLKLVSAADVLVENSTPGYLPRLGLGYPELSAANPGLIWVSITGFGQSGPYSGFAWSDIVAQALGGWMNICGDRDTPPLMLPADQAALVASVFGAVGALLALRARRYSGRGQHIDVSIQECVAATLDHVLPRYFGLNEIASRQGSLHWNKAFRIFNCRDGYLLASLTQRWDTLVEWMETEGMAEDLSSPEWKDEGRRRQGIQHIIEVMEKWTRTRAAAELEQQAQLMGFPWARVTDLAGVAESRQLRARGFFVEVNHPEDGRSYECPGAPCVFSRTPWKAGGRPPSLNTGLRLSGESRNPASTWDIPGKGGNGPGTPPQARPFAPLEGIRVLDFTRVLAGPYATRLLADFGAEVIKVRMPGDEESDPFGKAYYLYWNRNKLSVALDLSKPEGLVLAMRLASKSDVIVENFSPRVMANWGMDYENLRLLRPEVIMVSLSTQGHTGMLRDYVGYGPTVHALSGLSCLTAFSDRGPLGPGHAHADNVAGLYGAMAVLAALDHREKTGEGQYVDISENEAMCSTLGIPLLAQLVNGLAPAPAGNASESSVPHGCYRCKGDDQWCAIAVDTDEQWKAFIHALGNPPGASDPTLATAEGRLRNRALLDRMVEDWAARRTAEQVMEKLQSAGVPAGKVLDAAGLASDPQLNSRGFFIDPGTADTAGFRVDASPLRLSGTPARYLRNAPGGKRDAGYVFEHVLGLSRSEIEILTRSGAIGMHEDSIRT